MYPSWFLDHVYLAALIVISLAVVLSWLAHRWDQQHPGKSQFTAIGVQLTIAVLITFFLNNMWGAARDREERKWTVRQNHLVQLQPALRADGEKLSIVANRAAKVGRITDFNGGTAMNISELESLFTPHILTLDLANHYPEYWEDKQQLLKEIQRQDADFRATVARVSMALRLPSNAENRRVDVGRAYLEKCLGKGPGFTVEISRTSYNYTFPGGGAGGNLGVGIPLPVDLNSAYESFQSFSPDAETLEHCEALTKGAAHISEKAENLSLKAKLFAEHTSLTGDCEYTKLN